MDDPQDGIEITVATNTSPISIEIYPQHPIYIETGSKRILNVEATYESGIVRDITAISATQYVSSDTAIVTVRSDGIVYANSVGQTTITVKNNGVTQDKDVIVVQSIVTGVNHDDLPPIPSEFSLAQNYPNPFVKLAKVVSGKSNITVFKGSFHGRTHGAMALTSSKTVYRSGYQPLMPGVFVTPFPYTFRYGLG
jgi:hypothetical protein